MALIAINVTLSAKAANAGPIYDVYYSINGAEYILAQSNVSLPSVGSSVVVDVDEDYCRIRLVDVSAACQGNTNTIDFGICCSSEPNPILSLEYENYTSGSLIWSSSNTLPKTSQVLGGLNPVGGLEAWQFNGTTNLIAISSASIAGILEKDFTINMVGTFPSSSTPRALLGNPRYNVDAPNGADAIIRYDVSSSQMALDLRQNFGGNSVSRYMMPINTSSLQMLTIRQNSFSAVEVFYNGSQIPAVSAGLSLITGRYRIFNNIVNRPPVYFGYNEDRDTDNYNGALSDLLIYSRSLSDEEIYNNYNFYVNNCISS